MAQHDYVIANGTGAAVRSDLNNALAAIVSQNSGATEPATTYAYQFWADTTTATLKLRNSANSAWIELMQLDGTLTMEDGTEALPGLSFRNDLDTGLWRPGANQLAISTNAVERVEFGASEVVFNDGGANYDFRVEGDTNANLLFVDASADAVGIGTSTPGTTLQVVGTNSATVDMVRIGSATKYVGLGSEGTNYNWIQSFGSVPLYINPQGNNTVLNSAGGNVGIGSTTSPGGLLHCALGTSPTPSTGWTSSTAVFGAGGTAGSAFGIAHDTTNGTRLYSIEPGVAWRPIEMLCNGLIFKSTNNSEAARFDTSGRLLVGTSTARSNYFNTTFTPQIQFEATDPVFSLTRTSNTTDPGYFVLAKTRGTGNVVVQNGDDLGIVSFQGNDGSEFVQAAEIAAQVDGTPGANDMPGRLVFSTTADGASSPTERMRIQSDGYINIGNPTRNLAATGVSLNGTNDADSYFVVSTASSVLALNRQGSDGDLIRFFQASAQEGVISVSGSTVTYGGGHLARWSQLPNDEDPSTLLKGTVMSNLDEMCKWDEEANEQLNKTKVSNVEGDPNVAGVFVATSPSEDGPLDFFVGMTGDMIIRIAAGVTVERGDLLMSAGDGTAKPQDDDIIRSKTIAKVTSTNVSCTYEDGSYCVPCVLMAC